MKTLKELINTIRNAIGKNCHIGDFILTLPLGVGFLYFTPFLASSDRIIGAIGEQIAANLIEKQRFRLLDRNWRCCGGEIDIIAYQNKCVVFCEVKTRKEFKPNFYPAFAAINENKKHQLKKLGSIYLAKRLRHMRQIHARSHRFDIITVTYKGGTLFGLAKARHYPNAFS